MEFIVVGHLASRRAGHPKYWVVTGGRALSSALWVGSGFCSMCTGSPEPVFKLAQNWGTSENSAFCSLPAPRHPECEFRLWRRCWSSYLWMPEGVRSQGSSAVWGGYAVMCMGWCRWSFSGDKPLFTAAGQGCCPSLCCFQVASIASKEQDWDLMSHGLPVAGSPLLLHTTFCDHLEEQKIAPADNQSRLF